MQKLKMSLVSIFLLSTSCFIAKLPNEAHSTAVVKKIKKARPISTLEAIDVYSNLDFEGVQPLSEEVFQIAYLGYQNLKKQAIVPENQHLLSICDFSLSSNVKRFWVIDVENKKVLFNTLVAHGKGTGEEFAEKFSNTENSHKSSLGFYTTDITYQGSNGYSLRLKGWDKGYNDAAYQRAIVMHGADYVSEDFAQKHKRIGRSWGCPALPREIAIEVIDTIKGGNVLFVYYPQKRYLLSSQWLKGEMPN
ncbi:murein L,D-transpeptidase catalytic domain family protein [Elizabethkingia sp. JS20170427COW]|uniref:murein L,D-transpeptidase catalytic domain family protein n=1 Tax=Elizabethkingia sp. JS20170427COW TaxID=2583851 RepID=UPI001110762F|nr:murein L,D-transpeptidase catalytic domain family protein [Elizabethkingia sp. JS20170427COW]QCX53159.1 murein L,D-transpeptidase catalytic domain family protein [Elizabethkingia sp. JS20170427COW]